ncbi:MAG: DNA-directed RNA polymerase subunit L [Candidatus Aenigmatarchaeota archaeon]
MEIAILEETDNKIVIEVRGEDHTLLNILREACWQEGAEQASYMIEHPYMSQPKLIVYGKNPRKIVANAAQVVIDLAQEFLSEAKKLI